MRYSQQKVFLVLYGMVLSIGLFFSHFAESTDICPAEKAKCQASFYPTYLAALALYPKVKIEAKMDFNKFFVTGPCLTICLLKVVHKIILTLPPITSPDFTMCSTLAAKLTKQKQYCYQGQCLLISQIAPFLPQVPGIPPIPTLPPIIPTIPGVPIIG